MTGSAEPPRNSVEAVFKFGLVYMAMALFVWGSINPWVYGRQYSVRASSSTNCLIVERPSETTEECGVPGLRVGNALLDARSKKPVTRNPKQLFVAISLPVALTVFIRLRYGSFRTRSN
jgi:hypothetical protein